MKRFRYFCVLRFLHVDDSKEDLDKMDDNYDLLWKMITVLE